MRELRDAKLHGKQALYRDFFMLGFYLIGINVSDLLTLKKEDFRNGRISYYRNKTGRLYDIKVEPEAMEIISRYRSRKPQYLLRFFEDAGTFDVDHFTNNMNRTLRRIGPKDPNDMRKSSPHPIDSKMSTYYNRHSWATFASEIGIPLAIVSVQPSHRLLLILRDLQSENRILVVKNDIRILEQSKLTCLLIINILKLENRT